MVPVSYARLLRAATCAAAILLGAAPALQADPLRLVFVNENTTYGSTDAAWILFSYTGNSNGEFVGTVLGTGEKSGPIVFKAGAGPSLGSYFSESYPITDLAEGVDITAAPSTRVYVSLGRPLDAKANPMTPDNPFSDFGIPSSTAGPADPNWNVRWDFFELTLSDPRSAQDYGDISAINQLAIPFRVELYKSTTDQTPENLLQSAVTSPNPGTLLQQLTALANGYTANNNAPSLAGNWHVKTPSGPVTAENPFPDTFLRQVGPASGGTRPEWIGPFPSMNAYAQFVGDGQISTHLMDTTSVKDTLQQTYDMTTSASFSPTNEVTGILVSGTVETSTWNAPMQTWNPPTPNGITYEIQIDLDSDVGTPSADYSLSNALYGSAWQDNDGVTYWTDDGGGASSVTKQEFLDAVSANGTMALQTVNQWMQNLFVGYTFGLVGNTGTVSNLPPGHHLEGVSMNDMGSAGWSELKGLIDMGELSPSDLPLFSLADSMGHPLYNRWAKIVFEQSETVYGMQYSDMFQPLLALYTYQTNFSNNQWQPTAEDVLSWKVTILPVPEPGPSACAAVALAALWLRRRLATRAHAPRPPGQPVAG
jgi:hypothetical protein